MVTLNLLSVSRVPINRELQHHNSCIAFMLLLDLLFSHLQPQVKTTIFLIGRREKNATELVISEANHASNFIKQKNYDYETELCGH